MENEPIDPLLPSIPVQASAKQILAAIDAWAAQRNRAVGGYNFDTEVRNLWNVLTALRGPDSDSIPAKLATTARIRGAFLPFLAAGAGSLVEAAGDLRELSTPDRVEAVIAEAVRADKIKNNVLSRFGGDDRRDLPEIESRHFTAHISYAARV